MERIKEMLSISGAYTLNITVFRLISALENKNVPKTVSQPFVSIRPEFPQHIGATQRKK